MRTLLLLALLNTGCASFGGRGATEKFVLEVIGYRIWNEVYYYTGRTETQWMMVCRTVSPEKRSLKNTDIIVKEKDILYQCPTGTVLECSVESRAIAAWEKIAKRESATVDLPALRAKAEELERKAVAMVAKSDSRGADSSDDDSDASIARQEANQARSALDQAELFVKALVISASDVVRFEVTKEASRN